MKSRDQKEDQKLKLLMATYYSYVCDVNVKLPKNI